MGTHKCDNSIIVFIMRQQRVANNPASIHSTNLSSYIRVVLSRAEQFCEGARFSRLYARVPVCVYMFTYEQLKPY